MPHRTVCSVSRMSLHTLTMITLASTPGARSAHTPLVSPLPVVPLPAMSPVVTLLVIPAPVIPPPVVPLSVVPPPVIPPNCCAAASSAAISLATTTAAAYDLGHRSYDLSRRCHPSRPPSWPRPRPATTVTVTAAAVAAQPLAATPRCREPLTGLGQHVAATPRPCPQQHPPQPSPRFMATGPAPSPLCG